jgi:hypothetical protein
MPTRASGTFKIRLAELQSTHYEVESKGSRQSNSPRLGRDITTKKSNSIDALLDEGSVVFAS